MRRGLGLLLLLTGCSCVELTLRPLKPPVVLERPPVADHPVSTPAIYERSPAHREHESRCDKFVYRDFDSGKEMQAEAKKILCRL